MELIKLVNIAQARIDIKLMNQKFQLDKTLKVNKNTKKLFDSWIKIPQINLITRKSTNLDLKVRSLKLSINQ